MQVGFRHGGNRPVPGEECRPYDQHESDDFCLGLPRLLGLRIRPRLGQLGLTRRRRPAGFRRSGQAPPRSAAAGVWHRHRRGYRRRHRRLSIRPVGSERLFPGRTGRRRRAGPVLLHDGVDEHCGHHPHRRHGRTMAVEELLPVRTMDGPALRHLRQLGLGWRLAGRGRHELGPGPRSGRLRRLGRRSRPGRHGRAGRRHGPRPADRKVHARGQAASHSRPSCADGRGGHAHPGLRLVRLHFRPRAWPPSNLRMAPSRSTRFWRASPARSPPC